MQVADAVPADIAAAERMLSDAYELVVAGWCQGAAAHDECGRPIEPASAFARRWSAAGALERLWRRSEEDPDLALQAFQRASLAFAAAVSGVPQEWNDVRERHQSQVLDALAEAIFLLSADDADRPLRRDVPDAAPVNG